MLASFLGEHFLCAVIGPIALCEVPTNYCYGSLLGYAATPLASTTPRAKKLLLFLPSPSIFLFWACPRCCARGQAVCCYSATRLCRKGFSGVSAAILHAFVAATFRVAILLFLSQRRGRPMCLPALLGKHAAGRTPNYACH